MPANVAVAGNLIKVLDACLVDGGYPTALKSLVCVGTLATATTYSAHGFSTGNWVHIAGANEVGFNIDVQIYVTSGTSFTFAVALGTEATASGTLYGSAVFSSHCSGTNGSTVFTDDAKNRVGTVTGTAQVSTTQSKFGGGSLYLNGVGSYVSYPTSPDFHLGSGDFTIECWVYYTGGVPASGLPRAILGRDNINAIRGWNLWVSDVTGYVTLYMWPSDSVSFSISDTDVLPASQWVHIAVVRRGVVFEIYRDGVLRNTAYGAHGCQDTGSPFHIGTTLIGNVSMSDSYKFIGYIEDVRISKTAMYSGNFTPASNPFPSVYSTLRVSMAPAGWTKPFSGTNLAVYKPAAGSNGMYMRVDNTNVATSFPPTITCYENMTGVSSGTNLWATVYFNQQTYAGATGSYTIVASGSIVYLFTVDHSAYNFCAFGDIKSSKPSDAYGTICFGGAANNLSSNEGWYVSGSGLVTRDGHFLARAHTQAVGGIACGKETIFYSGSYLGVGNYAYPSPIDGKIHMCPISITEGSAGIRGVLPGLWASLHPAFAIRAGTFITGHNDMEGKVFMAIQVNGAGGTVFVEVTDTWGV